MSVPTKPRNESLSHIRAVSCMAVVVLHTFFAYFGFVGKDTVSYKATVLIRNLMFWAVPCFVMVTGALLLDPAREIGYKKIFRKYIPRMVVALVLFSLVFLGVDLGFGFTAWSKDTIPSFLKSLLLGQGLWSHMWYLYTMIGLYLILPVLHAFVRVSDRKAVGALVLILLFFLSVLPLLEEIFEIDVGIYLPVITVYPLYLVLGRVFGAGRGGYGAEAGSAAGGGRAEAKSDGEPVAGKVRAGLFILLMIVFAAGMSICTLLYLNKDIATLREMVTDYSFPLTVIGAVGVFGFIHALGGKNRALCFIDKHAFGIYLIHMIPLKILAVKKLFNPYDIGVWFVFVVAAGVFLVSLLVTYLLRLIPIVRRIL